VSTSTQTPKSSSQRPTHHATLAKLEKYRLLVESVEDYAIFLLDTEGYIQTWNKGARKTKGYTPDEIIGKHFSIFYLPEDIEAKKPERELVLARQLGRVEDEDWRVRKDGSQFWANVVITALRDETGELVGFAKVTRDLTERKHNEDLLRTNNAQLKRQQQELEALNISKDEFISLASHQLRTPATAIKQMLGMLIQGFTGEVEPQQLNLITRAYEANERQIRIVDNLLRVAQLDAGKVVLRKKSIKLHGYLNDIIEEHANSVAKKNQSIALKIDKTVPHTVILDADHFRMALGNLVDNASKYSHNGSNIVVKADAGGDKLFVSVCDSGVGISMQDLPALFGKFSRIPNELSEKVGGNGLGLYWVRRVARLHGGEIRVTSKLGKGSTFTIELPLEEPDA
jgi:PAS domain S-box-containing protein